MWYVSKTRQKTAGRNLVVQLGYGRGNASVVRSLKNEKRKPDINVMQSGGGHK